MSLNHKKVQQVPTPPQANTSAKVHYRTPAVAARDAAKTNAGKNPLLNRLYHTGDQQSAQQQQTATPTSPAAASSASASTTASPTSPTTTGTPEEVHQDANNKNLSHQQLQQLQQQQQQGDGQQMQRSNAASTTLLGYRPPNYSEFDLKQMVLRGGPPVGQMPAIHSHDPRLAQVAVEEEEEEQRERLSYQESIPPSAAIFEVSKFRVAGAAHAPKQFTYMVVRPRGTRDLYNPYDLQVVEHKSLDTTHYVTVSAAGVTRFDNGTSEFIELKNWEREHRIYHRLAQLDVFKNYKTWKSFDVWRKLVRRTKISSHKAHLSANLFLLNKDLSNPLRKVRDICIDLQDHALYSLSQETKELKDYEKQQYDQLRKSKTRLNVTMKDIKERIERACKDAVQTAAEARDAEMRHGAAVSGEGGAGGEGGGEKTASSGSLVRRGGRKNVLVDAVAASREAAAGGGHKPSYIEQSQKRAVNIRLTSFIRLCDYLVINALANLAMKAVRDINGDLLFPKRGMSLIEDSNRGSRTTTAANTARGDAMNKSTTSHQGAAGSSTTKHPTGDAAAGAAGAAASTKGGTNPATAAQSQNPAAAVGAGAGAGQQNKQAPPTTTTAPPGTTSTTASTTTTTIVKRSITTADDEEPPFNGINFYVHIEYVNEEKNIVARPAKETFVSKVDEIIREYITTVTEVPKFASLEVFKTYTSQSGSDANDDGGTGADVGTMVMNEEEFRQLSTSVKHSLNGAFHQVVTYMSNYDYFRDMYHENNRFKAHPERIKRNDPPLDQFRDWLSDFKNQIDRIEKIPNSKEVAIFCSVTQELRTVFKPSPDACIEVLRALLPEIATQKNTSLLDDLQDCNKRLETELTSVEDFVSYQSYVTELDARMDSVTASFEYLRALFNLLDDEQIKPLNTGGAGGDEEDDTNDTFRTGTRPMFDRLRLNMQKAEDDKETQQRHWSQNILDQLEDMRSKMEKVVERGAAPIIGDENADLPTVIDVVSKLQQETEEMLKRERELCKFQESFNEDATPIYELREDVARDINDKVKLWTGMRDWQELTAKWCEDNFASLDHQSINEQIAKFTQISKQVRRTQGKNPVVPKLLHMVDEWRNYYPVIQALKNQRIRPHHNRALDERVGQITLEDGGARDLFSSCTHDAWRFQDLINHNILDFRDDIVMISLQATEEDKLMTMLEKVSNQWVGATGGVEFQLNQHKDLKDVYVLAGASVEEVTAQLEDAIVVVSTISASKYCVDSIAVQVREWEDNLRYMQTTLDKWLEFQRNWMYLENIFSSSEIRQLWKNDAATFTTVDRGFRDLMRQVHDLPYAYAIMIKNSNKTLDKFFDHNNKQLEGVLASVERRLEEKRKLFPRFYFLSNDDLLDILAKIKQPELITPHMLKMFDGIKSLSLSQVNDITHINSMEGEKVELSNKTIKAGRGQVESWLGALELEMFSTLRKLAKDTVDDYENRERSEWMFQHPVQLVLIVSQIFWSMGIEAALRDEENPKQLMSEQLELNTQQLSDLADLTGLKLSRTQRSVLSTLITLDVHGRDLVAEMVENNVTSIMDFGWTKLLRSYWDIDPADGKHNIFICQNNSRFVYGYEYLGAQGRLVITPLTDRVFMTITGALKLYLGAAPAGPAGTGKTESVKDLAKNLARQCIVYNCFSGDTPVTLADGTTIPIEDIDPNVHKVLTFDREKNGYVSSRVLQVIDQGEQDIISLTFSDGRQIRCTPDHRFMDTNGDWMLASEIPVLPLNTEEEEEELATTKTPQVKLGAAVPGISQQQVDGSKSDDSLTSLPSLGGLHLIDRRTAGRERVYDITVEHQDHNFLANGVTVSNCSDGITYKMMEKFFMGLIQCGAWTCLDEFNRINIQVLSVIASQLLEIQIALQALAQGNGGATFTFQGNPNIRIRETYGVFVTMNPGYAGRTELPDNLKILFRPVAVMTPDFRMIAEVILYSEGFKGATELSLKITQLYKLSSEQLSPQEHYDFGMRALKSILVMAGDLKRSQPTVAEDRTLIVACNDSNVPKFVAEDIPLFHGIMQDLFPGATFKERDYPELLPAFQRFMDVRSMKPVETWIKKGIQFYETLIVRHGVMLVGITNTGKTSAREGIAACLDDMSVRGSKEPMARPVHQHVLNPKSIAMQELYGSLDVNTNEWKDGILAVIAKKCVKEADESNDHNWIVFDGPVDTLWIESMNSVLDDSKLLCLDSGERIKLSDTIHMLFEVNDLAVASPATVSRCGMVYLDESHLPWAAQLHQWTYTRLKELGVQKQSIDYIHDMFTHYCTLGFEWLKKQPKNCVLIGAGDTNLVVSCCDLFAAVFKAEKLKLTPDPQGDVVLEFADAYWKDRNDTIKLLFAYAFSFSFGGNIDSNASYDFDQWLRDIMESVPFASHHSVFDCYPDFPARKFTSWETRMTPFDFDPKKPFFSMIVPTLDTVRYKYLAKTLIMYRKPFLFSGHSGVGKSVIIADALQSYKEDLGLVVVNFQFSARTSAIRTQELIESKLKHKRKHLLGAPPDKHVIFFVDDLNMPQLEVFGASPPIELLRQMIGNGGFYDRKIAGFFKTVEDVTMVAACGPPEGGRNPVTKRLTRMFHLIQVPILSEDSMRRIFMQLLQGFFNANNFNQEVRDTCKAMVSGTVEVFLKIRDELRPKPSTPHYTFNLRDISKCIQGMMQVIPRMVKESTTAARLWLNENLRCFCDRLTNHEDRQHFNENILFETLKRSFYGSWDYAHLFEGGNPIIWGDFLRFGASGEDRMYEEVTDFNKLYRLFDEYLEEYNTEITLSKGQEGNDGAAQSTTMDLVFFKDHCEHLARIIRIIRQPRGSALLVGVGGSGKQSLTRLATSVAGYKRYEIAVSKGYQMTNFREKLMELYKVAGVHNKHIVFLINDSQLVLEGMLEDINNILNSGEVPSLFPPEERDKMIVNCTEAAREQGILGREEIFSFFISRVRDNLHIVLCMSPVGDAFRTNCRQFPSLTNCCAIDWFDEWPKEALHAVASKLMKEIDFEETKDVDELITKLTDMCVEVHSSVAIAAHDFWDELRRRIYITPTSYLEFISMYRMLLYTRRDKQVEYLNRLKNGKVKMRETNETIAVMKKELEVKQPLLKKADEENRILVADLNVRREKARVVQVAVGAQQEEAAEKQGVAAEIEANASALLEKALPAVREAEAALDSIDKSDLAVLKALPSPSSVVVKTVTAAMVMFEPMKSTIEGWNGGMDWKGAREFLSFTGLLVAFQKYPKDNIKPSAIVKLLKIINEEPVLTPDVCESRGTKACRGMCLWFLAMIKYDEVAKEVKPLRASQDAAQAELVECNSKLQIAEASLKKVEDELDELQQSLNESTRRAQLLKEEVERCSQRLNNAESLSSSLKNESIRWETNIGDIEAKIELLPVDMFLAAAAVSYFGAFTMGFRKTLMADWLGTARDLNITQHEKFSIIDILGDPVETLNWQICSLPTDETSTENAIIVSLSNHPFRWPMLIDPQGQAAKWILNRGKLERGVTVLKQTENNYMRKLDMAIRTGQTVLLDDCSELLDPALEPLLMRQIFKNEGGEEQIQLTPQQVAPYNSNFRLFMVTKLSNPHFLPDVTIKATIVNFTVTRDGLEDQMLGEIVGIEMKELEEEKNKIIQAVSEGQKQLKKFEEDILRKLQKAEGNILDDNDLIEELKRAQTRATFVAKRQVEAQEKIKIINSTREMYRDAALRSALLFFVIADLSLIDPMYQYSLEFFKGLVANVVRETERPAGLDLAKPLPELFDKHLSNVLERMTEATYIQVCRGLFNRDKMILSLLMCTSILRETGDIQENEWQYYIRASALASAGDPPPIPESIESFMNPQRWELIQTLIRLIPVFKTLVIDMCERSEVWMQWVMAHEPHLELLPGGNDEGASEGNPTPEQMQDQIEQNLKSEKCPRVADWEAMLTPFQKMLLIRSLREEKMMFAAVEFVKSKLGRQYTLEPPFNLGQALSDSSPAVPIIFILSQGADPQNTLLSFAKEKGKKSQSISLGQGQEEPAKKLIESFRRSGDWAVLQNCHLSEKFMPELEIQVAALQASMAAQSGAPGSGGAGVAHTHPEFRLWLTSMPVDFFSVFVLQNSIKITTEPPTGIRANMIRCFNEIKAADYDEVFTADDNFGAITKEYALKKLLYSLCFFHSICLERKKFGPLGWNVKYEWNDTDFHVSKQWLTIFLQEQNQVPWESLLYIIGQINYGGRVTDPQDRVTLAVVLRIYFNELVLKEGHAFSASGDYAIPGISDIHGVRKYIDEMSTIDSPEAFGMHENANLRHQQQISQLMSDTILLVQPRLTAKKGSGALSPEEQVAQKCIDFKDQLPAPINRGEAHPSTFRLLDNGLPNSLSTVLSHELVKYNALLTRIEWSLSEMQKAMKGLTVLSSDLDAMFTSFLNDQVPKLWSSVSYLSLKPLGAWFKELIHKLQFIRAWVQKGEPSVFWMPGFYNQASFMTGVLQMYARKHIVSVDKLGFRFGMVETNPEEVEERPEDGVYISGIFTDSWRWDSEKGVMADSLPREMHTTLPIVHFVPEAHHKTPSDFHRIPVYRTTARAGIISSLGASSNFVLCIEAKTDKNPDYWTLKGAACMAALNY